MFRVFYYTTFLLFLFGALVFWVYADNFFNWWYGFTEQVRNIAGKENFVWAVMGASVICLALSIWAITQGIKEKVIAYLSLFMSAITLVMFVISFFGHGVMPVHGIL